MMINTVVNGFKVFEFAPIDIKRVQAEFEAMGNWFKDAKVNTKEVNRKHR
ncbi:MAG: hypothetical protein MSK46_06855 [Bacteroidales bacterium]|nr:hypothetical protein [Bacteroidales bacterium]